MAGSQCQFTGAWRGGFLHCWPELCLPELQESFSSDILLEIPTRAEERKKKGEKKKVNLYKSALLKCHAHSRPCPVWDGTSFWQKSPQFCTCDEAVCVPWLSLLASCPANSKDLRNSDNSPCTVLLWASMRVHRHLGVIKDGLQGKSMGFPTCLPVCGVQRSGWPELQVGQCIQ